MPKKKIAITIDNAQLVAVDDLAKREERSRSQIIAFALRDYLAARPAPAAAKHAKPKERSRNDR